MGVKSGAFADRTKVPISSTKAEIEDLLAARGAHQFGQGWDEARGVAFLGFTFLVENRPRQVRMLIPISRDTQDQEQRSKWRSLLQVMKSRFIAIDAGISTFEREFMPDLVLANGQTMAEWATPQIEAMYQTNRMPALLPGLGDK